MRKIFDIEAYPFIQTHTFNVKPYLDHIQGYAPFIASSVFTGEEDVRLEAPRGFCFPDTGSTERRLNEFANGQWFFSSAERTLSATSGPLPIGKYHYKISSSNGHSIIEFDYIPYFLEPISKLNISDGDKVLNISWEEPANADNYWIFAIMDGADQFFKNLVPLSENMFVGNKLTPEKSNLKSGIYRIAVRANQMWTHKHFRGFVSESWKLSDDKFNVP